MTKLSYSTELILIRITDACIDTKLRNISLLNKQQIDPKSVVLDSRVQL